MTIFIAREPSSLGGRHSRIICVTKTIEDARKRVLDEYNLSEQKAEETSLFERILITEHKVE